MDGSPWGGGSDWWKIGAGDTKSRGLCGPGVSGESKVNVGLTQGSALSMAVVEDGEANLQEQLIEWKDIFSRHGLRVRLVKTEVMWVGYRRKEL